MTHKQWRDAADYRSIHKRPYSSIKQLEQLSKLNIRQLKQLVSQINQHLGITISKQLSAYLGHNNGKGRAVSNLRKAELIDCIWYLRQVQMQRPVTRGEWELDRVSDRIYQFITPVGEAWTHYIACATEQEAFKLYSYLMAKGDRCNLASYRRGDRTHGAWEIKVWRLSPDTLGRLLERDTPLPVVEEPSQPEVAERETLEQKAERYNNLIANGGGVGLKHVLDQLASNPKAKGLVMSGRGMVVVEDEF